MTCHTLILNRNGILLNQAASFKRRVDLWGKKWRTSHFFSMELILMQFLQLILRECVGLELPFRFTELGNDKLKSYNYVHYKKKRTK